MLKKLTLAAVLVFALALTPTAYATHGDATHCPDKDNVNKVESATGTKTVNGVVIAWSGDPGSVTFTNTNSTAATVVWCAKGGNEFSGEDKNSHEMTTVLPAGEMVTVGPFGTAISYFIDYSVTVEEEDERDLCPNIGGNQSEVPSDKVLDEQGDCVVPGDEDEDEDTPGIVLGDDTQVKAPVGGVKAGAGGASSSSVLLVSGLIGSLAAAGYGALRLRGIQR